MNITDEELRAEAKRRILAKKMIGSVGLLVWNEMIELLVTAMREQPWVPSEKVSSLVLCKRAYMAEKDPPNAKFYLEGQYEDAALTGEEIDAIAFALNWAKEREKQDG